MASSAHQDQDESLDDFWREYDDIEQGKVGELDEEEVAKIPDDGELEEQWLADAGYVYIVDRVKINNGRDLSDDELEILTSSLTVPQAQAVKRRVSSFCTTLRKKKGGKKHVKDIFHTPDNSSPESNMPDGPVPNPGEKVRKLTRQQQTTNLQNLVDDDPEHHESVQQGIEAMGVEEMPVHELHGRTPSHLSVKSLPAISDADITIDFHLEQKDSQPSQLNLDFNNEELPEFQAKDDPLGVTLIGDLSQADMEKIRSLAFIELTALFDQYNIVYTRQKRKTKAKERGLFGVPIHLLLEHDPKGVAGGKVPLVFSALVSHLEKVGLMQEGILRVSAAVAKVKRLRMELEEKFHQGTFCWTDVPPNECAALLKQFLRELPVPLLSNEHLDAFLQVDSISNTQVKLKALNLLILLLPMEHIDLLKALLQFLQNVVKHSAKNKMGLSNVSMIMAPNLFMTPVGKGKVKEKELDKASKTSSIVGLLIHYQRVLWMIPSSFVTQVRVRNKADAARKFMDKFRPWKRNKFDAYKKPALEPEVQDVVTTIKVRAPDLTKNSCLIQLEEKLKAGDIVNKFRRDYGSLQSTQRPDENRLWTGEGNQSFTFNNPQNAQFADNKAYLFEVGGNIGERCLDPNTLISQLHKENPGAEWVVRINVNR